MYVSNYSQQNRLFSKALPPVVMQRSGVSPPNNADFPGILNHPWMRKFGEIDHKTLETRLLWVTPTAVPFIHLALDDKKDRWGLFARDEMAILVGGGIFLGTQLLTHKLFNHFGWFATNHILEKDKGDFLDKLWQKYINLIKKALEE